MKIVILTSILISNLFLSSCSSTPRSAAQKDVELIKKNSFEKKTKDFLYFFEDIIKGLTIK